MLYWSNSFRESDRTLEGMKLSQKADLTNFSTLRVKAEAEELALPESIDEVIEVFNHIKDNKLNWNILGAGSNLLLSSRGIDGVVICTTKLDFIKKISDTEIEVGSGVKMPRFCAFTAKESLAGAEFMEGIPGTIGGGVVMNAGAHGSEISDIVSSVKIFNTETWQLEELKNQDLEFKYRKSKIDPKTHIVLSAIFSLKPDSKESIRSKISENNQARSSHQPIKAWTCGCTFKNPDEHKAGLLIQEIGAKGMNEGSFQVSEKHGNFFENNGVGSSEEFCKLMAKVQEKVFADKGVILQPEVQTMGNFTDEELLIWSPKDKFKAA